MVGWHHHAVQGPSAFFTVTGQDFPERSPEVNVTQSVAQGVDGAVDVAQPVTWRRRRNQLDGWLDYRCKSWLVKGLSFWLVEWLGTHECISAP